MNSVSEHTNSIGPLPTFLFFRLRGLPVRLTSQLGLWRRLGAVGCVVPFALPLFLSACSSRFFQFSSLSRPFPFCWFCQERATHFAVSPERHLSAHGRRSARCTSIYSYNPACTAYTTKICRSRFATGQRLDATNPSGPSPVFRLRGNGHRNSNLPQHGAKW